MTYFSAEYLSDGTYPYRISLGSPEMILDRNGDWVEALPLRRQSLSDPRDVDIEWLDRDLRLVRVDDKCDRHKEEGCETASFEWGRADFPPYLPLGFAGLSGDAVLSIATTYEVIRIPVDRQDNETSRTYWTDVGSLPPRLKDFVPSAVEFGHGELAPRRVHIDATLRDPYQVERQRVTRGESLRLPDPVPPTEPAFEAFRDQGRFFPGERETLFGINYSHLQLIDGVSNATAEIRAASKDGCLRFYDLHPAGTTSFVSLPSDGLIGQERIAVLRIAYAQENAAPVEWKAEVYESMEGPRFVMKESKESPLPAGCPPDRRHWPTVDSGTFMERARNLVEPQHPVRSFMYEVSPPGWLPGLEEDQSWHTYRAFFTPEWMTGGASGGYKPLRVTMDASSGLLVDLVVDAADHDRVDRRTEVEGAR